MTKRKSTITNGAGRRTGHRRLEREAEQLKEMPLDAGERLTEAERVEWETQRAGKHRRRRSGPVKVLISIDYDLLSTADAFAKQQKLTRSALVAHGLEAILPTRAARLKSGAAHAGGLPSESLMRQLAEKLRSQSDTIELILRGRAG